MKFNLLIEIDHNDSLQEVKVQELSEDVPVGHIPRSLTVQVKGDLTRSLGSGSHARPFTSLHP